MIPLTRKRRNSASVAAQDGGSVPKARRRLHSVGADGDMSDLNDLTIGLRKTSKAVFRKGAITTTAWEPLVFCFSLDVFLKALLPAFIEHLQDHADAPSNRKVFADVRLTYVNVKDTSDKKKIVLRTKTVRIVPGTELGVCMSDLLEQIRNRNATFIRNKSGVVIESVDSASLHIGKYNSFRGASFVELPEAVKRKKAVVNVQNTDNRCFGYAILACKYFDKAYKKCRNDPKQYDKYFSSDPKLPLHRLQYPVCVSDLGRVERELNQPINVVSFYDDKGFGMYSVYHSKLDADLAINLLYWKGHYAWISNFQRLMYGVSKHKEQKHFCMKCFCHFGTVVLLKLHQSVCEGETCQQICTMAPVGATMKFRNIRYQQTVPFVIYADFECLTQDVDPTSETVVPSTPENILDAAPKQAYQRHTPCSVGLLLVSTLPELRIPYEQYFGEDSVEWMLNRIGEIESMCLQLLFSESRLIMDAKALADFAAAKACYICGKDFGLLIKVRDHDHVTGNYRGAAHQSCNLKLRTQYKIPIFMHNFRGYDSHVIVTALGMFKGRPDRKLNIIGQGMESYLTLSLGNHLVFKDSLQFMPAALGTLVDSLATKGKDKFELLRKGFPGLSQTSLDLLIRKGVYPYDYMNTWTRFAETQLPGIEQFASRLRAEKCSQDDYDHAERVWSHFKCKTLKDYHDIYLKTDVLLLADAFEEFRRVCMTHYQLDAAHYVSDPQFSWDAMMKMTECELDLLSDPAMYRMLEGSLRGGISMISKRYSRANNPRLGALYDPTQAEKYLLYLDANNLYGWAMSQYLPSGGFRWIPESEFSAIDWTLLRKNSNLGYFVECDLDYPKELHDAHNEYPLAPERFRVTEKMLSEKQREIHSAYTFNRSTTYSKLVPNLYAKTKYCVHYRNLKFYLKHGMVLQKVHRVIEFRQSPWMKQYIQTNQDLRALATTVFDSDVLKLKNNTVYGKSFENQRKRTDIRLLTDEVKAAEYLAMPHVIGFRVFTKDVGVINMMKTKCLINRPFYVGFSVLELSKLHMYRFHYDFVKPHWPGEKSQLMFTDTDSLMYEIRASNVYETIWNNRDLFDLSDYPADFHRDISNKKVIGKFKDETSSKPILEFVGLRPKMYSFITISDVASEKVVEKSRAKGIQRAALKHLRHADYLRQLNSPAENKVPNRRIGAHLHRIFTYEVNKRALCSFDDKRFILPDGINSLAFGHWSLNGVQDAPTTELDVRTVVPFELDRQAQHLDEEMLAPGLDPENIAAELRAQRLEGVHEDRTIADMLDLREFVS
jgi:hypothetical protein